MAMLPRAWAELCWLTLVKLNVLVGGDHNMNLFSVFPVDSLTQALHFVLLARIEIPAIVVLPALLREFNLSPSRNFRHARPA